MIEITAIFPVLVTENLNLLKDFYISNFGFQAVFYDADFYLHLLHEQSGAQIGFLIPGHPSQPAFLHSIAATEGMVISFEVPNAQSAYETAMNSGLEIAMDLKIEPWGQNHFMVKDPQGYVIDIVQHVGQ